MTVPDLERALLLTIDAVRILAQEPAVSIPTRDRVLNRLDAALAPKNAQDPKPRR